jgi:hypothetical protein
MKRSLKEEYKIADEVKMVATNDKELVSYAKKWEDFMLRTIKEANELHKEGAALQASDVFELRQSQTRNRFVLARLGSLKSLVKAIIALYEQARKET